MMEGTVDLDKMRRELDVLKEKYTKADRSLKYVRNLIESYKKDRHSLQVKVKQANEEIESIEKRLAEERLRELNDFRQLKKAEVGLAIVKKRVEYLDTVSEAVKASRKPDVTMEKDFDDGTELELMARIKSCKEKINQLFN